ncbi:MAG TPA: hypothetical protein VN948_03195 [Terriglobales bacterium]|nr:hypothetical protein [Terriglobales bacterium]
MAVTDLQAQLEGRLNQAGLLPYLDKDESRFVDLEDDFFVELVARDSTKLPEIGRIVEEVRSGNPRVKTLVRAHWEIEDVGRPYPAYNPKTGTPRTAASYPVDLKSGQGTTQIWVEVSTLASMVFKGRGLDVKGIVRDNVAEQLSKGGASYWDPERFPRLEINANMAEYIASRNSALKQ